MATVPVMTGPAGSLLTRRAILSTAASIALAGVLILVLAATARVDTKAIANALRNVDLVGFIALGLLMALNSALAAEKWRLVDGHLQGATRPRAFYLSLTGVGQALGQVLPAQVAMVMSRALGSWLTLGSGALRSAGATLLEQAFDILAVTVLAVASLVGLATGSVVAWSLAACAGAAAALHLLPTATRGFMSLSQRLAGRAPERVEGWLRAIAALDSRDIALGRTLLAISVVRFAILCLMAGATSWTTGLAVPTWHLAVAMPLVVLATVVPLTPGGIGINEWTFATVLLALGTPGDLAALWTLLNRLLTCAASLAIGVLSLVLAAATHARSDRPHTV